MTEQENHGAPSAARTFTRPRRLTAAVAFSVGVGSLVYGTVLALPASAATAAPTGAACSTAPASPSSTATKSDSGTATPSATGSDSPTASASPTATGSATPTGKGSPSADPTQCAPTRTSTPTGPATATAAPSRSGGTGVVSTESATSLPTTASATPSATKTTTGTKTGTTGSTPPPSTAPADPTTQPPQSHGRIPDNPFGEPNNEIDYTDLPPGNAPNQIPTGTITRAQIIARAQLWVEQQVPYSQTEWWKNVNGDYRQDCSGYVSMAWDLDQYTDFWTGNLNEVSHTIPAADLQPGDNLLSDEHTVLFAGWADPQHTEFDYYEEAHPGTVARYVVDAPLSAFLDNGFTPFEYDGVVGSTSVPANPANGDLYSTLALTASEINPPDVNPLEPLGLSQATATAFASAGATASPSSTELSAQVAADDVVSSEGARSEGAVLGAAGLFLLGAGVLIRRPVPLRGKRSKRGKH